MSDPNPTADFSLAGAPGSELDFDVLFPNPEVPQPTTTVAQPSGEPQPAPPAQPAPAVPQPDEYFLKAPTGTVYKTREEAERGIAEKDRFLEQFRAREIQRTGIDPVSGRFVGAEPTRPVNYMEAPEKFYRDLSEATGKNDPVAFSKTFQKFVNDMLAPVAPVFGNTVKRNAIDELSLEFKDFAQVYGSPEFRATIEEEEDLRNAIQAAEQDPNLYTRLKGMYRIAYRAARGRMSPQVQAQPAPSVASPQPARPTLSPSSLAPTSVSSGPDLSTREGRQAQLKELEKRFGGISLGNVGL